MWHPEIGAIRYHMIISAEPNPRAMISIFSSVALVEASPSGSKPNVGNRIATPGPPTVLNPGNQSRIRKMKFNSTGTQVIDNVRITAEAVPEPASLVLSGLALALLVTVRQRRFGSAV